MIKIRKNIMKQRKMNNILGNLILNQLVIKINLMKKDIKQNYIHNLFRFNKYYHNKKSII